MSKEFINLGLNRSSVNKAHRQEKQLSYFTQSDLQDESITSEYLKQWAERKYQTNDYFLNFVKSVFKTENFLAFFKYMRNPLPSAKLINNVIKPQLNRVFVSENADFKYDVANVDPVDIKDTLNIKDFQEEAFEALLFNHNSIVIEDVDNEKINEPYRYFLNIKDVLSIDHDGKSITRIAYSAIINNEAVIIYIDGEVYAVYDRDRNLIGEPIPHDLGRCPANFVSSRKLKDDFIIKESIFSYIREELEEYVFLKTLQKMTDPNGAIPVVTKIETSDPEEDSKDKQGEQGEPNTSGAMASQRASVHGDNNNDSEGILQPGSIHEVAIESIQDDDGKLNMDAVKNFLNFFYIPTEALDYLSRRVEGIENSIISTIIGTVDSSNEESKNEMQIEKSIIVLENTLIYLADNLNTIRTASDYNMLGLKYGKDQINEVFIFYGTDFFLESQNTLFDNLAKASNPIERKNILVRINQNKYKNNPDQMIRQKLLYDLLPYTTDDDFGIARDTNIDPITLQYQLRFNYWIGIFEAQYGDMVSFYTEMDSDAATRLLVINNLIIEIIKKATFVEEPATN